MSETSDPDYWMSLHHFDDEEGLEELQEELQEGDGGEVRDMEVDQSHMAMNDDGVPDADALQDDATVDDRIHDLELARRHEAHVRQRSGELLYESNNLEIAIGRLQLDEPYVSGQPIENWFIERLYAQHAPHMPLPGRSDYPERIWVDYGPTGNVRHCLLENGAPGPRMTYIFNTLKVYTVSGHEGSMFATEMKDFLDRGQTKMLQLPICTDTIVEFEMPMLYS